MTFSPAYVEMSYPPKLPRRGKTHITDTLAVRRVFQHLPSDLLVRSMEERDYGIDLQLERFDDERPTGQMALVQVKGTAAEFTSSVSISDFPVKTIEYACLFDLPFFVFHTSTKSGITYFVWLQRYASLALNRREDGEAWRTQEHVTIHFPPGNRLDQSAGIEKLNEFIGWQSVVRRAMDLLRIENELRNFGSLALGPHEYPRGTCIRAAQRLATLGNIFGDRDGVTAVDLDRYSNRLVQNFAKAPGLTDEERVTATELLKDFLRSVEMPLRDVLNKEEEAAVMLKYGETAF